MVSFMKTVEDCCSKVGWNEQATFMDNEVIIDCEVIFDFPNFSENPVVITLGLGNPLS